MMEKSGFLFLNENMTKYCNSITMLSLLIICQCLISPLYIKYNCFGKLILLNFSLEFNKYVKSKQINYSV